MSLELPTSAEIETLRAKCRDDTITDEELYDILTRLRSSRSVAATRPVKTAKALPSASNMLEDL